MKTLLMNLSLLNVLEIMIQEKTVLYAIRRLKWDARHVICLFILGFVGKHIKTNEWNSGFLNKTTFTSKNIFFLKLKNKISF